MRWLGMAVLGLLATPVAARIAAEHPSDYVRVLEAGPRELWEEAVHGLLGDEDELPMHAVSSVVRRLPSLSAATQLRVIEALREHPRHRRTAEALDLLADRSADGRVRAAAREVRDRIRSRAAPPPALSRAQLGSTGAGPPHEATPPAGGPVRTLLLVLCALVAGVMGLLLFVWGFRLQALALRIRQRPISRVASLAMGPVALEGEVQPARGYLAHPVTGEICLYYAGAERDHPSSRFYLVDESGRVLVDPREAVLFSDDGVLVPGERVHLVGHAVPGDRGAIVRSRPDPPSLPSRLLGRSLDLVFGLGSASTVSKMLFTDPGRSFWIWDDLEHRPMAEVRDYAWLLAGVLLGGAWMVLFALAVLGLVDEETSTALERAIEALPLSS